MFFVKSWISETPNVVPQLAFFTAFFRFAHIALARCLASSRCAAENVRAF